MSSSSSVDTNAVLSALDALYKNPEKQAKENANQWLQDFQKTSQAWQVANSLLLSQNLPLESRIFASQTFRNKATYDIDQLPRDSLLGLRTTLLTALEAYSKGPKVIQIQICLALADLALQLKSGEDPEWGDNVVKYMINKFGKDPSHVSILLQFLTILPEELTMNQRIPVTNDHYHVRCNDLLSDSALDVLQILTIYSQAQGITQEIQSEILVCLASWLKSGEITIQSLLSTPLFAIAFDSLADEQLFDVACDCVCDIIHETQEIHDNQEAVQMIAARLLNLRSALMAAIEATDDDKVRGLCRIYVQGGETYHGLVLQHYEAFAPIVGAILECACYHDLDIVQITFRFWYYLSQDVARMQSNVLAVEVPQMFQKLLEAIIKHLRFPNDLDTWNGQDRDDFKSFRHYMGDTLKDCCNVLGSKSCLAHSLSMIQNAASGGNAAWQDVEAPLFSLRAMGAKADPRDEETLPLIMDIIPALPNHPRLTYAGLLVIARYTGWIKYHSSRIPAILSYISAGFSSSDSNVCAAAASAFNYLGQDCDQELTPFLPQLFEFYTTVCDRVEAQDAKSIVEAIAYVIASLETYEEAMQASMKFVQPLLQNLATVANAEASTTPKAALQRAADEMEQIETFLKIISNGMEREYVLPASCAQVCKDAFNIIDAIIAKFGKTFYIAERACELLRRGIAFFNEIALPIAPLLLQRLSVAFNETEYSSYVWIIGKSFYAFGGQAEKIGIQDVMRETFDQLTQKVVTILQRQGGEREARDVLDDYIHTCSAVLSSRPQDLLANQVIFSNALEISIGVLEQDDTFHRSLVSVALEFLRDLLRHEAFAITSSSNKVSMTAEQIQLAPSIVEAITLQFKEKGQLLVERLTKLIFSASFELEMLSLMVELLRLLMTNIDHANQGQNVAQWLHSSIEGINSQVLSPADKRKTLNVLEQAIAGGATSSNLTNALMPTLQSLFRSSRKSRERQVALEN